MYMLVGWLNKRVGQHVAVSVPRAISQTEQPARHAPSLWLHTKSDTMACETIRQGIFLVKSIPGRSFISTFCTESAAKLDLTGECKLFIIFEATIPCQLTSPAIATR
jgi:hypothetical protein